MVNSSFHPTACWIIYTAEHENSNIKAATLCLVIHVCVRKWGKIKKGSRFLKTVWQYLLSTQTKWPSSFHLRDVANKNVCFYGPEEMCTKMQSHRLQGAADWKQVKCLSTRESYFSLGSPGKQNLKWKLTFCHVPKDQTWRLSWWRTRLRCRRHGFDPWVGKIPWRRERLPTPVLWPGESHGLYTMGSQRVRHDWAPSTFTKDQNPREAGGRQRRGEQRVHCELPPTVTKWSWAGALAEQRPLNSRP